MPKSSPRDALMRQFLHQQRRVQTAPQRWSPGSRRAKTTPPAKRSRGRSYF